VWLPVFASIAMAASTGAASASACQEFKKDKAKYKRCLAYQRMAGTPTQRRDAEDQYKQDKARKRCRVVGKSPIRVCDDYKTRAERAREKARKEANRGVDNAPLKSIPSTGPSPFGARR
jgi:hypothetical protein